MTLSIADQWFDVEGDSLALDPDDGARNLALIVPPASQLLAFFEALRIEGECWIWTKRVAESGYGNFRDGDTAERAHRVSFRWFVGPIAEGFEVHHLCRRRACVNPYHLQALTDEEHQLLHANARLCAQGHLICERNSYLKSDGRLRCGICHRVKGLAYKRQAKANVQLAS